LVLMQGMGLQRPVLLLLLLLMLLLTLMLFVFSVQNVTVHPAIRLETILNVEGVGTAAAIKHIFHHNFVILW
jgi:hypothetical protein